MGRGWANGILVAEGINMQGSHDNGNNLGTDGFLLIGNSTGFANGAALTAGTGIVVTNGSGSITLSATGGGLTWTNIGVSQALANNNGYICGSGGAISLSLPSSAAVGTVIEVVLNGSTSWTVTQGAGQSCRVGGSTTSVGVGGSIASTAQGNWIRLVCSTAGTTWTAVGTLGNLTTV